MTWLVAGLGNPGEGFAATRHNAGAMVVDELASRAGERFRKVRFIPVEMAETNLRAAQAPDETTLRERTIRRCRQ